MHVHCGLQAAACSVTYNGILESTKLTYVVIGQLAAVGCVLSLHRREDTQLHLLHCNDVGSCI